MTKSDCNPNILRPSELNRKIVIQEAVNTVDVEGIPVETWSDVMTVWAARNPASSRWGEFFDSGATNARKSVRYRIRYRPDRLSANMRLLDELESVTYNIVAVLDDYFGDRTQTHLMTEVFEDGE